ncbi:epoxide hydrolase family protein [Actinacidiphila glaucinigra]|uniref:Pimeloyl-ACP methyl ester carboxylesterase n=1 Tax=Actinacidiphila glaucinigra TaxID=235986 RepID=A0A239NZQ8_9ACTN|nr:epoxide hydrolase family protein [Actinacidiphila glaucinigra]SNT60316.1 Pimeloyl-ACP methyl ester carboxylesterase [Actinacidiphila glaucinigra]
MTSIRPFRSQTSPEQLTDLRERLVRTRLAPALSGPDWTHGTPPGYLAELVEYWRTRFDWNAAEERLNSLPQFLAEVDGTTVHYVHAKGVGPRPFPLLFAHGWPGSFWEVHKIIGPLTEPGAYGGDPADAFDLVAPSLPGYGFSPHPGTPGLSTGLVATLFDQLMSGVLGYSRYGAQGGDWGAQIISRLARQHGGSVVGIHLNMLGEMPVIDEKSAPLTPREQAFAAEIQQGGGEESAYAQIQGTRPSTLAAGLSDSPAGLAAWMVEKFRAWSDCGGDVESVFSKDELLTNITLYWLTNSIASSSRLYYEAMHAEGLLSMLDPGYVTTPTGYASFANEIISPPEEWVRRCYNLTRFTEFKRGGHFAALERPDELVADIREFFRPLRA